VTAHLSKHTGGVLSQEKSNQSDVEVLTTFFKAYLDELRAMRELLIQKGVTTEFELHRMANRVEGDLSDVEVPAMLFVPFLSEVQAVRRLLIEKGIITTDELNEMAKRLEAPCCGGVKIASNKA
jgi:hypothetical protein